MAAPQSYQNHSRFDPLIHSFVLPIVVVNVGVAIYIAIHFRHDYPYLGHWAIVISLALMLLAFKCRINDLKLQDRIIRLEERLRLASLMPTSEQQHIAELTLRQLTALRFASDEEVAALAHRALTQEMEPKAIKQAITNWRADHHRV